MINWKSEIKLANDRTNLEISTMTKFSIEEIKSLKNRINFYIAHYSIIIEKLPYKNSSSKLEQLKKILNLIENEIKRRNSILKI